MKLILLRHEERSIDIGFYSNLTDKGIINSCVLPIKLKNLNIDVIFCSPFIRTLQTIYYYCVKYSKKVNIEYGLYEYLHNPYFLLGRSYFSINDINDNDLLSIINNNYLSVVDINDFVILENEMNLERRIIKMFDNLKLNYNDKTILIVSHKGIINKIKDLYVKRTDMNDEFNMGHIEIYDI
jgi:broad specificity phosphatase PhoE